MTSSTPRWTVSCYRNGYLLVLGILVLILAGVSALTNLPRIEDPRITTRNAIVITPFPGASAERVEALVTKPLEDRLREVDEIKELDSTSRSNISVITIELEDAVTKRTNRQIFSRIRDKLADAEVDLPAGAGKPEFDDQRGASAFAIVVGLSTKSDRPQALGLLTRLAEELADRIRNLPGAERVEIYGGAEEEIVVSLDQGELAAKGLTAGFVAKRVASSDPKDAAGALRGQERDLFLEVEGELDSLSRIRNLALIER